MSSNPVLPLKVMEDVAAPKPRLKSMPEPPVLMVYVELATGLLVSPVAVAMALIVVVALIVKAAV